MHQSLVDALDARRTSLVSDRDVESIADLGAALGVEKQAGPIGQEVVSVLRQGALYGGLSALAGLGVAGAAQGGRKLYDVATKKHDLEKILDVYPHLKEYPRKEIDLAYNSIRTMNPIAAKDPLTGGTLLSQVLRMRDPSNPKALRFEPDLALNLMKMRPQEEHKLEEAVQQGVQSGMQTAVSELSKRREQEEQHGFMRDMEGGRRNWEEFRDRTKLDASRVDARTERNFRQSEAARMRGAQRAAAEKLRGHGFELETHKGAIRGGQMVSQLMHNEQMADRQMTAARDLAARSRGQARALADKNIAAADAQGIVGHHAQIERDILKERLRRAGTDQDETRPNNQVSLFPGQPAVGPISNMMNTLYGSFGALHSPHPRP